MNSIQTDYGNQAMQQLSSILGIQKSPEQSGIEGPHQEGANIQLSGLGQILQSAKQTGSVEESDIKAFFDDLKQSIDTGTIDIASLAENAPEWLQSAAESSGIDLNEALTEFVQNAPSGPFGQYDRPPMPPPPMGQLGDLFKTAEESGDADKNDIKDFMDNLKESLDSGSTIDIASLAENAPEWLQNAAEEAGIDLETALTEFVQNAPEAPGNRPPMPPPGMEELGNLLKTAEDSDEVDTNDIQAFMDNLKELLDTGSVDIASLIEIAPEWLQTTAEETGLNLETVFNNFLSGLPDNNQAV